MLHWIGGDARTPFAKQYLQAFDFGEAYVLPYPAVRNGKIAGSDLMVEEFVHSLSSGDVVVGGALHDLGLSKIGVVCADLMDDAVFLTENAVITAENAIALAKQYLPCTIRGSKILVIGYGRIGFHLCRMLHALQAEVDVYARKEKDQAQILSLGYGLANADLQAYRCIFNTVPQSVLTNVSCFGGIWMELASVPYGIADPSILGDRYHLASGLPAKLSPQSAGIVFAQAVKRQLEGLL